MTVGYPDAQMAPQTFFSPTFYYTVGPHAPGITVGPGASLRVICPDSDNELSDGTILSVEQRQRENGSPLFEGNPLAGPIFIEGAKPGDALAIRIDRIELDRTKGQTGLAHGHGVLPPHLLLKQGTQGSVVPRHLFEWRIDTAAGTATVVNTLGDRPIRVPLNPFIGCLSVCPPMGQSISTLEKGVYGGNMDLPLSTAGATVYLPVQCDGGLLFLGDLHAAQGHGEIIGGGIETSGNVEITIDVISQAKLPAPRFRDATYWSAVGVAGDLLSAVQAAYAHLLDWVVAEYGLNRWDAYNMISQAGSIVLGNLAGTPLTVAARLPISVLPMA